MKINSLNDLPDWDEDHFKKFNDDEGDEWKPNPTRDACKAMYQQWQLIMTMLNGVFESDKFLKDEFNEEHQSIILGDAFEVGAKIRSSEVGNLYVLKMENAAIIRKNTQFIASSMLNFMMQDLIEEKYSETIRREIDEFKKLFKHWISTFQKDEYEDYWGLFV